MNTPRQLVFATNNAHKLREARQLAGDAVNILSLSEIGCHDDIEETGTTLAENSLIKARWVKERYGYDCFADDTGLCVDALGGAPGVYSARFAGPDNDSAAKIALLLEKMEGEKERKAHFSTVITLIEGERVTAFEGRVDGTIATTPEGNGGFGYDPVFVADETGIPFACMSAEEKNSISHRGRALRLLFAHLKDLNHTITT